jgi:hypothetical protein
MDNVRWAIGCAPDCFLHPTFNSLDAPAFARVRAVPVYLFEIKLSPDPSFADGTYMNRGHFLEHDLYHAMRQFKADREHPGAKWVFSQGAATEPLKAFHRDLSAFLESSDPQLIVTEVLFDAFHEVPVPYHCSALVDYYSGSKAELAKTHYFERLVNFTQHTPAARKMYPEMRHYQPSHKQVSPEELKSVMTLERTAAFDATIAALSQFCSKYK